MEVRPSTVHGLGVFTTKSFKEGDLVCRYSGDCLRNVTGNESKYILQLQWYNSGEGRPEVWYLDSSGLDNFCGRYINDARHTPFDYNVRYGKKCSTYRHPKCDKFFTNVYALMDIPSGVELFVDYGDAYWDRCPYIPMTEVERLVPDITNPC